VPNEQDPWPTMPGEQKDQIRAQGALIPDTSGEWPDSVSPDVPVFDCPIREVRDWGSMIQISFYDAPERYYKTYVGSSRRKQTAVK
jgi:hypothetical protein